MATTDYNKLKVTELKDVLKERGIPSTGLTRKQQIIEALEAKEAEVSRAESGEADAGGGGDGDVDMGAAGTGVDEREGDEGAGGAEAEAGTGVEAEEVEAAVAGVAEGESAGESTALKDDSLPCEEDAPTAEPETVPASSDLPDAPTVLEADQPVSREPSALETPQRSSPALQDASSDTRKRKRRSPTPPVSAESVNKKLKSAEGETVKLPEDIMTEDAVVEDAPVPLDGAADTKGEETRRVQPYSSSDDTVPIKGDVLMSEAPATSPTATTNASLRPPDTTADDATTTAPAKHPATAALYIRDLIRPLQPTQLRNHITHLATPPSGHHDDSILSAFHLDTFRTHAFALFTSLSAASRVRAAMHNTVFPNEPTRKPLWVDFVPEDKVTEWIETELRAGTSRRDAKRWEVVYTTTAHPNGEATARFQEVPSSAPGMGGRRQSSFSTAGSVVPAPAGVGMPNAPLGPRGQRPSISAGLPPARAPPPPARAPPESPMPEPTKKAPTPANESFDVLDERFRSTTAKPKLYYNPQPHTLADKRLDELDALTSRDWEDVRRGPPLRGVEGQLRRYTFEEGDRLVDGGADRGNFGVPPPSLGRGGRGGGGYRGGGGGYGGGGGGGRYRGRY